MLKRSKLASGSGSLRSREDSRALGYQSAVGNPSAEHSQEQSQAVGGPETAAPATTVVRRRRLDAKTIRLRDKEHCRFVATQPCIVCGRTPSEAHHIRFAQPRALGRKVSDEYTVPVCRVHHRDLHRYGDEASWWAGVGIDPLPIALELWRRSRLTYLLAATRSDAIPPPAAKIECRSVLRRGETA